MEINGAEALPIKAVVEELERLRQASRQAIERYQARLDAEIGEVQATVESQKGKTKAANAKLRDCRDMLTLLRSTELGGAKGRRKELKRIEGLLSDLAMLIEKW